ncbi:hypothetical protein Psch_02233 [Pelotomaculum schinkii]|uniref:Four helix bundle protein n=1 Tax=Pelotomaculum schinkii TaxID=78350 RepID=A0A4Y7RI56_9FIRM|nr:hypothetical protein Psch_01898 [Pelotomaculum schinkii]TEB08664.1 hypothetical protein Psch_02233 [Pelotomaculum schinkii]
MGYRKLEVYNKSYQLALKVHKLTQEFPTQERREIGSQIRRSAVSIALNIAEGYGRVKSDKEFMHFLRTALGSCNETRVLVELVKDLGYIDNKTYSELSQEYEVVGKQIYRLREAWTRSKTDN